MNSTGGNGNDEEPEEPVTSEDASEDGLQSDKLELVKEFTERMGNEVVGEIRGETGSGELINGFQCEHGDHTYLVVTTPTWEYVTLRYNFNGDQAWHVRTTISEITESGQVNVSQEDIQNARQELENELRGQPPAEKRELRLNLMHFLSREGCSVQFDTTEPLNIHGFNVDKKIFVQEDAFGVSDFERAVQTVVNLGWVGKDFLMENYGLKVGLE